ncbi:MAG: ribosome maturation factor RimP [Proteobacteria bacterium]|nr:ribosome maturation factor RimP [Pseudomonadota bacterium]
MKTTELQDRIAEIAAPVVDGAGIELVDVQFTAEHGRKVLRIFIDKPGGVTIDDCGFVSRELGMALDVDDFIPGRYSLEVSSPGLDRALKKAADFARFVGSKARVKTLEPIEERRNFRVTIKAVEDDTVSIEDSAGKVWKIEIGKIESANLIAEI